ncbi:MAG: poly(A) polymerase [Chlamydiales bacterium]|jgi:endonuclease/exonuclease/phosphatase family metal-dependent hydrolase|nr:poly(A) polymerase [Chlamydiales bacterium]
MSFNINNGKPFNYLEGASPKSKSDEKIAFSELDENNLTLKKNIQRTKSFKDFGKATLTKIFGESTHVPSESHSLQRSKSSIGRFLNKAAPSFTVLTWNISCQEGGQLEKRINSIIQQILKTEADIVVLQEVTPNACNLIREHKGVKKMYPRCTKTLGNFSFSSSPLTGKKAIDTTEKLDIILMEKNQKFAFIGDLGVNTDCKAIITYYSDLQLNILATHFKALDLEQGKTGIEKIKKEILVSSPKETLTMQIVMGSFVNWNSQLDEAMKNQGSSYVDAWEILSPEHKHVARANKEGYTYDPEINGMAISTQERSDRIYYTPSGNWQPEDAALIGTESIEEGLWASTHFGLAVTFRKVS